MPEPASFSPDSSTCLFLSALPVFFRCQSFCRIIQRGNGSPPCLCSGSSGTLTVRLGTQRAALEPSPLLCVPGTTACSLCPGPLIANKYMTNKSHHDLCRMSRLWVIFFSLISHTNCIVFFSSEINISYQENHPVNYTCPKYLISLLS